MISKHFYCIKYIYVLVYEYTFKIYDILTLLASLGI